MAVNGLALYFPRHGPRRRTIHEFASVAPILPVDIQPRTTELVDGPPQSANADIRPRWTMTSH